MGYSDCLQLCYDVGLSLQPCMACSRVLVQIPWTPECRLWVFVRGKGKVRVPGRTEADETLEVIRRFLQPVQIIATYAIRRHIDSLNFYSRKKWMDLLICISCSASSACFCDKIPYYLFCLTNTIMFYHVHDLPPHRFIDTLWTCAAHIAAVTRAPPPPTQCVGGVYYVGTVPDNLSASL